MDIDQQIKDQIKTLPKEVKDLIATGAWAKTTDTIADMYYLNEEQKDALGTEVMLAVLGIINPATLAEEIAANVGIAPDLAQEISNAIGRQVLPPLISIMDEVLKKQAPVADKADTIKEKFAKIAGRGRFPQETLMERFNSLPNELQQAVTGSQIAETVSPLAAKYGLYIDQAGTLAEIAILVMLGLVKTTDFIAELEQRLGVTKIKAGDMAYEIDQKLFRPLRNVLRQSQEPKPAPSIPPEPTHADDIIHPHPAQATTGAATPNQAVPKIVADKLTNVVTTKPQTVDVKLNIDPYRESV